MSKKINLESMSVDEMWQLHEEISQLLSVRLTSEKRELEKRLEQLRRDKVPTSKYLNGAKEIARAPRRKYPRVYPKYQNPNEPSETWSGRGKTPRWLAAALKTGHNLKDFAIRDPAAIPAAKHKNKAQGAH
jgi:DNA-binding protein H-NS